jgi:hypothetical protein
MFLILNKDFDWHGGCVNRDDSQRGVDAMNNVLDAQRIALRRKRALWVARALAIAQRRTLRRRFALARSRQSAQHKEHEHGDA